MKKLVFILSIVSVATSALGQDQQVRKLTLQELKTALEQPLPENCKANADFDKHSGALQLSFKKEATSVSLNVETTPPVYAYLAQDQKGNWYSLYQYSKEIENKRTDLFIQTELYGRRTVGLRAELLEKRDKEWVAQSFVDCKKID